MKGLEFRQEFNLIPSHSNSTNLCLSTVVPNLTVNMLRCGDSKAMKWKISRYGIIRSLEHQAHCLVPLKWWSVELSEVGLLTSNCKPWLLTKEGYLRYAGSKYFLMSDTDTGKLSLSHKSNINELNPTSRRMVVLSNAKL